jgi:hypothetical protein
MNLLRITDGKPHQYSIARLKAANPQVSFPEEITLAMMAEKGVYPFRVMDRPTIDANQRATLSEAFTQVDGEWVREWVVRTIAIEELRAKMVCTRLQGRLALGEAEIARLDAFIDSFPNSWALRQVVDNSVTWRRTSQDMQMLGFALGYDDERMDETFIRAMVVDI